MGSESQDDAHEHISHTELEEDVLKAFNLPSESIDQNSTTNDSTSHNAGHQGKPGMAFSRTTL